MVAVLSLYDQALADFCSAVRQTRVKEGDKEGETQLQDFLRQRATPQDAQGSIKALSDHAGKKYGSKKIDGKVVISQKWIDNIMGNIDHAIAVGNKLMAGAPESVSMAWFCVKLGMNAIQSNYALYSLFGSGLTAMTELMILIPHYDKMHDQRHKPGFSIDDMTQKLFRDIVACYAAVLDFLFSIKRHVEASALGKLRHGLKDFFGMEVKKFQDKQSTIMTLKAKVLEASDARFQSQMFEGMDNVQESLKSSINSFDSKAEELAQTQTEILQGLQDMRSSFKPKSRWDQLKQEYDSNVKKLAPFESDIDIFPILTKKRYAGTLAWLYDEPQYVRWTNAKHSSNLCVTGQEGVGKSVAISSMWEKLVNGDGKATVCHFSCTNEDNNFEDLGNAPADRIRHTLLYQLYSTLADNEEDDVNKLEEANKVFVRPKQSERQQSVSTTSADKFIPPFTDALIKLAEIVDQDFIFIVDGVDRLDEKDQNGLFDDLATIIADSGRTIKFLTGCRVGFPFASRSSTKEQCLNLSATDGSKQDVELVLDAALTNLVGFTESEKAEARMRVLERAQSLQYVTSIAIPFLQQPFQRPLSKRLDALPETITDSFRQALSSMNPTYYNLLETALTWTLYSNQPVRVKEIMEAFSGIYSVDLETEVGEEYERKYGYIATDLEAVQIQDAANRFLRIWVEKIGYLGVNYNHHYVDLIDVAQVRKFCNTAKHDPNDHGGHDHPLCEMCQPQQADQGCITLPEKEVHLTLALQLLRHINSPLFQRRFGLVKPDGSAFDIKEDTLEQMEDPEDEAVDDANGGTNGEPGTANDIAAAAGHDQQTGLAEANREDANGDADTAKPNDEAANGEINGNTVKEDDDDAKSTTSIEDDEDENVDLGQGNNDYNDEVLGMNDIDTLPMRYEIEQWPYHAKRADMLFTTEEKATDPRWKELIAELDKLAFEHPHVFRKWWSRYNRSGENFTYDHPYFGRTTLPAYGSLHAAARLGLTTWAKHLVHVKGLDSNKMIIGRRPLRAVEPRSENVDTLKFFLSLPGADPFKFVDSKNPRAVNSAMQFWFGLYPSVETVKLFMEAGADFAARDPRTGNTILHEMIWKVTDPEAVRLVLASANAPDINAQGMNDSTALHALLYRDEMPEDVLDLLLEHKVDVNLENKWSVRALEQATWSGKPERIEKILAQGVTDIDDPDDWGRTALHNAAGANAPDCIRVLVKHGAKLDWLDNEDNTALHDAARAGFKEAVETLIELGSKLDVKNKRNYTPFWYACNEPTSLEAAVVLLEAMQKQGIPIDVINTPSKSTRTPLRQAATQGHTVIVDTLIRLAHEGDEDVPAMLDLVDEGSQASALHRAALRGHVDCVRLLLEHGANALLLDSKQQSPLQNASIQWQISGNSKFEEIVLLLAPKDAENARMNQDLPATAAANGSIKVLKLLSKLGADINRVDSLGWSPLALAQKEQREEVVRFLKRHTANRTALPSAWVKHNLVTTDLKLSEDGLSVSHDCSGIEGTQICLSTNRPLPASLDRFYFEVTFKETKESKEKPFPIFAIGFCTLGASAFYFPGWPSRPNAASGISYAMHGDDGWLASPSSAQHGEKYGAPDTVGCGVDLEERKIWFTRNGERIEAEHTGVSGRLFPIIGLEDTVSIETNFGTDSTKPFLWKDFYEHHDEDSIVGASMLNGVTEVTEQAPPKMGLQRTKTATF